ncbi:MAG: helix-turn-helix transcriptional regulator [Bacteroidales bacterium]|nr:helix-turn-helix transcriptional regulator [Bacteroidales bacterium]
MKEQILKILDHYVISAARFSDEIGVQRSSISHIISGRNQPSYDFIKKVMKKYPELDVEWLLTGQGEMLKDRSDINKNRIQDLFSALETKDKSSDIEGNNVNNHSLVGEDQNENKKNDVTNVNILENIVFFFKNGTFREYRPE